MTQNFRPYQEEAYTAIIDDISINTKCIVKMFCGSGKSLIMYRVMHHLQAKLSVFVFPSLSLIDQFYNDYIKKNVKPSNILKICSEKEATTNSQTISSFLQKNTNKIICITYQSFNILLENLGENTIHLCCFDEAHHAVGETYQQLIFGNENIEKQIFFTATPKNTNGIVMYDRTNIPSGMCGNLVYDYTYIRGVSEEYLNPFEIRIDLYSENTNKSVYESIARAILTSGNNRVLTFHSTVNSDTDTSIINFVNEKEFVKSFHHIVKTEFPEKEKSYTKINMLGLDAKTKMKQRWEILKRFKKDENNYTNNDVIVLCSCETIGEGVDTNDANMCVFVDPKSSFVKIIQNIGRIVRKQFGVDKPHSTILIPCWVDKEKYVGCDGDREKCDEVIRKDMSKDGNFNGILNVLSALRQEDEDIYDICLHYPDTYSPQEIQNNLEKQGYCIEDIVGEGSLIENLEFVLEEDIDYELYDDCETDEEMITQIAEDNDVCIEIHSNSLENPIVKYNSDCEGETVRLYKTKNEDEDDGDVYQPIIKKNGKKRNDNNEVVKEPNRNRVYINVHSNKDVKVLWKISGDIDMSKELCSCILDCEVVDMWYERLETLQKFIDEKKQTPNKRSNDKDENQLGNWFSSQKQNYKNKENSMKDEEHYNKWSLFIEDYKEYFISLDEKWDESFINVKKFIDYNKRRPFHHSKNKDEKFLASWISNQNTHYKNKTHSEERYNIWTQFLEEYKQYFISFDEKWEESFDKVKLFMDYNKRKPLIIAKDKNETQLSSWISTQQNKYKNKIHCMQNEERYNIWTQFLEEYKQYFISLDEKWEESFNKVKLFIDNNKRRPSKDSKNKDEDLLGIWISTQNHKYKNKIDGMQNEERYNIWTKFLQEYKQYFISLDEKWDEYLNNVKNFMDDNKRKPLTIAKDKNEKLLGTWIGTQNINYKNKNKGMVNKERYNIWTQFLEEYKQYLMTDDEKWEESFNKVKLFMDENKKRPSGESKDRKFLASWISNQNTHYKNKTHSEERYNIWTQFLEEYKQYLLSDNEKWEESFNKVKLFMDENKKRPSGESKDGKFLASWIQTQNKNYKNKERCMKDEKRYNIWTKFREEYLNITDDSSSISSNETEKSQEDQETTNPKPIPKKSMKLPKPRIIVPTIQEQEQSEQKRQHAKSQISVLHQKYKTMNSANLNKEFQDNPDLWNEYHAISEQNEESFPQEEIPRNIIIKELDKIKTKRTKNVVDMGCGKAQISQHFREKSDTRFHFINYDHISSNGNVVSCDISNLPLEDDSVEIAILSLAMWGSNCKTYIKEAHRILESGGRLYIMEATKRWSEKDENGNNIEGQEGSKLRNLLQDNGFQIVEDRIEKFCMFMCIKI